MGMRSGGIVQNALDDDRKEARAKETGTVVKAISAEFSGVVGANPSCALAEEQHKWWMPNPSLGITISHERLAKEYGVVKDDPNPEALRTFCSQNLNLILPDLQVIGFDKWLGPGVIRDCTDPKLTLDWLLEWNAGNVK